MSLRYQIYARILASLLCILLLGGGAVVWQARNAVDGEIDSSIRLATNLVKFGLSSSSFVQTDWPNRFKLLKEIRHLTIEVQTPAGQLLSLTPRSPDTHRQDSPPLWFVHLVGGKHSQTEQTISSADGLKYRLIIQANPLDEITEVWQESSLFLGLVFLLTLLTFLAVHLTFRKTLYSIAYIVKALKTIETGDYRQKLPEFSTQEYDQIAKAINHMTGELNKAQQDNRALTQHSLAIQEDERQRLAQELHDELGQSLTAIKVMAVTTAKQAPLAKTASDSIVALCDHLMSVVRSMMYQLHPLVLTELGLKAALEDLLNHWSSKYPQLNISLTCPEETEQLDSKITIQIFRVVQECLTNIVRHADAISADISLQFIETTSKHLHLEVSDDGQGCAADRLRSGFGMLGMKERVHSLGGEFFVDNRPQRGLSVNASIPLP